MLLQQRIDLVSVPKMVINLSTLRLAHCRELDYTEVSI